MPLETNPTPDPAIQLAGLQALVDTQALTIASKQAELEDTQAKLDLVTGKMESDLADLQGQIADCQAKLADLTCQRDCLAKKLDSARPAPSRVRSQF